MILYDSIIDETVKRVGQSPLKRYPGGSVKPWPLKESSEFIMQREAACEIGGAGMPSVNYTCVTTSGRIKEDEIVLCGKDIAEIKGDTAFARIILLEVNDLGEADDQERAFVTEQPGTGEDQPEGHKGGNIVCPGRRVLSQEVQGGSPGAARPRYLCDGELPCRGAETKCG